MFHYIIDQIRHFYLTAFLISLIGWSIKSVLEILADNHYRSTLQTSYYPRIHYRDLALRFIGSIVPVANLWMIVYLIVPNAWQLITRFFKLLDQPIVPKQ